MWGLCNFIFCWSWNWPSYFSSFPRYDLLYFSLLKIIFSGPFIAKVTLEAYNCGSVDFVESEYPDNLVCQEGATPGNYKKLFLWVNKFEDTYRFSILWRRSDFLLFAGALEPLLENCRLILWLGPPVSPAKKTKTTKIWKSSRRS